MLDIASRGLFSVILAGLWAHAACAQEVSNGVSISELNGQTVISGTAEYDQVDYPGNFADYVFTRNADNSVTVDKPDGGTDLLRQIDGIWFQGDQKWFSINDVITEQARNQTITGRANAYDQVDYKGSASDYTFTRNDDLSISVQKPNGFVDRLFEIDGIWFLDEEAWYAINTLVETATGNRTFTGSPVAYDQVDYPTGAADYQFSLVSPGRVEVTTPDQTVDTLIDIDGIWFQEEAQWYSIDALLQTTGQTYRGGADYDQIDYPGFSSDYRFESVSADTVQVEKPNNTTDTLINYDGVWFSGEAEWYSIQDLLNQDNTPVDPGNQGDYGPDNPAAFGEVIAARLNGFCLTIADETDAENTVGNAIMEPCSTGQNQSFSFAPVGDAYQIRVASGQCLGVVGASRNSLANVQELSCSLQDHLLWTLQGSGTGVSIIAKHSSKCLNIEGARGTAGANLIQWDCTFVNNDLWQINAQIGEGKLRVSADGIWEGPYDLPLVPAAGANLPDGRILGWSARAKFSFGRGTQQTVTTIFDPRTLTASEQVISNTRHDMFCPGTAMLPDGRIMVTGGNTDSRTSIYDPNTNTWSIASEMKTPRGYHAMTPLSDGSILTLGGSWSGGRFQKPGEIWSPDGQWVSKDGLKSGPLETADSGGQFRKDNHMWLFQAPNGKVFHAGPAKDMHWLDMAGNGSITRSERRSDDADAMNGNAVMYDIGKILTLGGAQNYTSSDATARAYTIDINGGENNVQVSRTGDMSFKRAYHNSIVLPSGEVVVIGGQEFAAAFSDNRSVFAAEIWSPETGEFKRLADMTIPRNYHSYALLMKDGRIFAAGGGLCGSCSTNHPDAEIFTPPYLLNNDGTLATRPVISSAPAQVTAGTTISVGLGSSGSHTFALVRTSAATHSVNNDQRRIPLQVASRSGSTFALELPRNGNVLIPGNYFLFAMNARGVPSEAVIVNVANR
ncbi:MAG: RICIN domain-containing protein [Pseudomonadota bacterium]